MAVQTCGSGRLRPGVQGPTGSGPSVPVWSVWWTLAVWGAGALGRSGWGGSEASGRGRRADCLDCGARQGSRGPYLQGCGVLGGDGGARWGFWLQRPPLTPPPRPAGREKLWWAEPMLFQVLWHWVWLSADWRVLVDKQVLGFVSCSVKPTAQQCPRVSPTSRSCLCALKSPIVTAVAMPPQAGCTSLMLSDIPIPKMTLFYFMFILT